MKQGFFDNKDYSDLPNWTVSHSKFYAQSQHRWASTYREWISYLTELGYTEVEMDRAVKNIVSPSCSEADQFEKLVEQMQIDRRQV